MKDKDDGLDFQAPVDFRKGKAHGLDLRQSLDRSTTEGRSDLLF